VHENSKTTTLPVSLEITRTYVLNKIKLPWFIDLLNINLNNVDLNVARNRITLYIDEFSKNNIRITDNLDLKTSLLSEKTVD